MSQEEESEGGQAGIGLMRSVRQMFGTLLEMVQTRIELIANEVEEEREHLRLLVLYGLLAVLFLAIGLMMVTLFLVLLFWDEHRLTVVGVFAGFYLFLGLTGLLLVRRQQQRRSRFLSATVAELQMDRDQLGR